MAFSFGNIQTFIRHCLEPHVKALEKILNSKMDKLATKMLDLLQAKMQELDNKVEVAIDTIPEPFFLGEWYWFANPNPKPHFATANGQLIAGQYQGKSITNYPIWDYLQSDEGRAMCITESAWHTLRNKVYHTAVDGTQFGYAGIGGAPFYVINVTGGSIRLPDLRGMYAEAAGSGVGHLGVGIDTNRKLTGSFRGAQPSLNDVSGAFITRQGSSWWLFKHGGDQTSVVIDMDTNRMIPTGPVNRPKHYGAHVQCYLGRPR